MVHATRKLHITPFEESCIKSATKENDSTKLTMLGEVLHYIPHNYWDSISAQSLLLELQKTHTKHLWTGCIPLLVQWKHSYLFHVLLQSHSRFALLKGAEGKKAMH